MLGWVCVDVTKDNHSQGCESQKRKGSYSVTKLRVDQKERGTLAERNAKRARGGEKREGFLPEDQPRR